jgi:hypothetical protein
MTDRAAGSRAAIFAVVLAVMPTVAPAAQAQPSVTPRRAAPAEAAVRVETRRYGWQIFLADVTMIGLAAATERDEAAIGFLLAGPVIHALHGRLGAAGGSLLLRTGGPLASALLGLGICAAGEGDDDRLEECADGAAIGFVLGSIVSLGVDYFVLARKTTVHRVPIQPAVTVSKDAATAGVRLSF